MRIPILISVIVLIVSLLALATPWYPETTSKQAAQTLTQLFTVPTTNYQTVTIYSLPNPIELSDSSTGVISFTSQNFTLQEGTAYQLDVTMNCKPSLDIQGPCWVEVEAAWLPGHWAAFLNATGRSDFVAPDTGLYNVWMGYLGYSGIGYVPGGGRVSAVSITTNEAQTAEVTQTTYNTVESTVYSQSSVPPYMALGALPVAIILVLLGLLVALTVLRDQGIISVFTKHPRQRRRSTR